MRALIVLLSILLSHPQQPMGGVTASAVSNTWTFVQGARRTNCIGSFAVTSVANASAGTTAYTGTITGGNGNTFVGDKVVIAGFTTGANNGTFTVTASTNTILTVNNTAGVAETATATAQGIACAVALTAVAGGAGDVIVFRAGSAVALAAISTATIGSDSGTLVASSGCRIVGATSNFTLDCAYRINPTAGGTVALVTVGTAPAAAWSATAEEYKTTLTAVFDTVGTLDNNTATTSPVGPTLTLSGSSDVIAHAERGGNPTAVSAPYTSALGALASATTNVVYLLNTNSGAPPTWTTNSAKTSTNAIAFKAQ
jgi:hypothetical protein